MKILVVNCGSSSIKYQLFDMADESVLAKGILERLGTPGARLSHRKAGGKTCRRGVTARDHAAALKIVLDVLVDPKIGVLDSIDQIDGAGHRVVHGGQEACGSARIDEELIEIIKRNAQLAPLHNGPNLAGIESAMAAMPNIPHVAVFDTAFLSTLAPRAYRYAVPNEWYSRHHVRRYGFHGTSHRYVALRAAEILGRPLDQMNLITAHLGNGCSMTAVAAGRAVDHSMGMTPLEGLVMGTRSGDLDPAVVLYMQRQGLSPEEVDHALNEESGLFALSGCGGDMRDLLAAAANGHKNAELAIEVFVYRVVKYIGAYYVVLPGLDAIVFTGGIGQNAVAVRAKICRQLSRLGVVLDEQRNAAAAGGRTAAITTDDSPVPVWVIPTNEELMIARDTAELVRSR